MLKLSLTHQSASLVIMCLQHHAEVVAIVWVTLYIDELFRLGVGERHVVNTATPRPILLRLRRHAVAGKGWTTSGRRPADRSRVFDDVAAGAGEQTAVGTSLGDGVDRSCTDDGMKERHFASICHIAEPTHQSLVPYGTSVSAV